MPKKIAKKRRSYRNVARGNTTDEIIKLEEGRFYGEPKHFSKIKTSSPKYAVSLPEGFNNLEDSLIAAEAKVAKTSSPKLARIPTEEFFNYPPPEERERLRREASEELRMANAKAETEVNRIKADEYASKMVERDKLVVPEKKSFFHWARGKSKKRKSHTKHKKGKNHSIRRK
jgi:hypothetical protein